MCGRFTLTANPQVVRDTFNLTNVPGELEPRFNVAPTQPVAVITNEDPKTLTFHRWGLIPSWAKDISIGSKLINARADSAHEKPAFRAAFKRRRCIIPADGFYEWQQGEAGKTPHFIHLKGQPVFGFAGLWEIWHSPDGDELRTCTILTTDANAFVSKLHNRMPVILTPDNYEAWLSPEEEGADVLMPILKQYDASKMAEYEVSKAVNRASYDAPDLIRPVA